MPPLGTLTLVGKVPTIGRTALKIVPTGTLTLTGKVPSLIETVAIPLAQLYLTGLIPLVGDEVLHIRSSDGATLHGTVEAGDACMIVSKGDKWYVFSMPSED